MHTMCWPHVGPIMCQPDRRGPTILALTVASADPMQFAGIADPAIHTMRGPHVGHIICEPDDRLHTESTVTVVPANPK